MAQITIASKKKYQVIKNFVDGIETQTFDVPDETTTAEVQNTASIEADKYVSVRRFWAGISRFLALAQTFLAKITFQVAPRFNSTTASLPLKVDANNDLISGQITNTDIADNAVTNPKLAQASPNTIKSNPTNATNNVQDLAINANAFVGRLDELNSGNLTSVPVAKMLKGKTTLIDGGRIVFDTSHHKRL